MRIIAVFVLLASSISYISSVDRINQGASTSRDLTQYEEIEILNYAQSTVRLMLAEETNGASLTDMISTRFDEIVEFHNEIFSYSTLAEYGSLAITDLVRRTKRIHLYLHHLRMIILETVEMACSNHFDLRLSYEYSHVTNTISVTENVSFPLEDCLCENERERMMLSAPFSLPLNNHSELTLQFVNVNSGRVSTMEAAQYHIIPLSLISRFFQVWLTDESTGSLQTDFNDCVVTLFGRIRRSMQKILIAQVRNSPEFSNDDFYNIQSNLQYSSNNTFFFNMFGRAYSWLNGNVFIGPRNRGPFSPTFERDEGELLEAFEFDSEPIIGRQHYRESLNLFFQLLDFLNQAPSMFPFDRLLYGFSLFSSMTITLSEYPTALMHSGDWELREPTDAELSNLRSSQLRRVVRGQRYWSIKKQPERSPRSVEYHYESIETPPEVVPLTMGELKIRWSQFVEDMMKIVMEARSRGESVVWSCNFTRLYKDYLKQKLDSNFKCNYCKSFDEYLFSKIKTSWNWRRCNNAMLTTSEWCLAWKQIVATLVNYDTSFIDVDGSKKVHARGSRSVSYLRDVEVFTRWLSSEFGPRPECKKTKVHTTNPTENSHKSQRRGGGTLDVGLCYFSTLIMSVFSMKDCHETLEYKSSVF